MIKSRNRSFDNHPRHLSILIHLAHLNLVEQSLKGSVQRKLRWVENDVTRSIGAWDCGAGHSFVILLGFHLGFTIFQFPVSTVKILGDFWSNR
jgi:hypothetical protein